MENKLLINLKVVSTPVKVRKGYLVEATFKRRSGKLDKFDLVFKDTEFFNKKFCVFYFVGNCNKQ